MVLYEDVQMSDQTDELDWRTDGIYQLVLQKVEKTWLDWCKPDAKFWRYVLVEEYSLATRSHSGNMVRGWVRDENGLREISLEEYKQHRRKIHGRIFPFVLVSFHIHANRQRITIKTLQASTADTGGEYLIEGEGDAAKLVFDPEGGFWIS